MKTYTATCPRCRSDLKAPWVATPQTITCGVCTHRFESVAPPPEDPPANNQAWELAKVFLRLSLALAGFFLVAFALAKFDGELLEQFATGLFAVFVYLIPSFAACFFKRRASSAIFIINLFLGWTLIGWVGALAWAAIPDRDAPATR